MGHDQLHTDNTQLDAILDAARCLTLDHLSRLPEVATGLEPPAVPAAGLPIEGGGALAALADFQVRLQGLLVASPGPRYFGYVTGGVTPAALLGDWLTAAFDQNAQSPTGPGDVSALVEVETVTLLRQLLDLPATFHGGFVTGATMSTFTCLGVARQWAGARLGVDVAREGVPTGLRILAATPHSSAIKALAMLGLGSARLTRLPTLPEREAMGVEALAESHEPTIVIASGGTVNTVDFDDLRRLAELKQRYPFWLHIDAAFGALAACSPQHAHLLDGWHEADSITVDGHKWLNVPYDSGIFFVRQEHAQLQMQTFQNSSAPYLGDPAKSFSYLNFVPENSRRLRALATWFTLMAYGRTGYRQIVETNIRQAQTLGQQIEASTHYSLAAPVRLNVVCFTLRRSLPADQHQQRITTLAQILNRRSKVFMTPTVYQGKPCLRAALVNWRTTAEDVEMAVRELEEAWKSL